MAFTSTDLDAIEAAIAAGVLEVRYADKIVKYQAMSDLFKAREAIKRALSRDRAVQRLTGIFEKGLR